MNIAPYALIQAQGWRVADSIAADSMSNMVRRYRETASLLQSSTLLRPSPLGDSLADSLFPVGLYTVPYSAWSQMRRNAAVADPNVDRPELFMAALRMEIPESALLFPDDSTDQPNFAVFAPVKMDTGVYVLNHLRFWLDPESDRIKSVDSVGDGKCALLIKASSDSREIGCSRTGCRGPCKFLTWLERGRYETFGCRCEVG